MNWYYARGEERMGPVDDQEIAALASTGQITGQTLVWCEGMADWTPWSHAPRPVDGALPVSLAAEPFGYQPCVECGRTFLAEEMVAYEGLLVCAECKPIFFQRLREGGAVYSALKYAGFWIRVCAALVDGVILFAVNGLMTLLQITLQGGFQEMLSPDTSSMDVIITMLIWMLYMLFDVSYDVFFVGKYGATPGKMILGLRVVRSDGSPVTYYRALGRYFALWLSSLTLYIGFIIAAFDDQKRTLHDHICDTRVVYK